MYEVTLKNTIGAPRNNLICNLLLKGDLFLTGVSDSSYRLSEALCLRLSS